MSESNNWRVAGNTTRTNRTTSSDRYRPPTSNRSNRNNRTSDRFSRNQSQTRESNGRRPNDRRRGGRRNYPMVIREVPVVPPKPVAPTLTENNFPSMGTAVENDEIVQPWDNIVVPDPEPVKLVSVVNKPEATETYTSNIPIIHHHVYEENDEEYYQPNIVWDYELEDYVIDEEPYYYPGRPMMSVEDYYLYTDENDRMYEEMEQADHEYLSKLYRVSCFRCNARCRHPECGPRCNKIDGLQEDEMHAICDAEYDPYNNRHHACYLCHSCHDQVLDDLKTNKDIDGKKITIAAPCGQQILMQ